MSNKLKGVLLGTVLLGTIVFSSGCQSMERDIKSAQSEYGGGLDRHISVYSDNGTLLTEYDGKVDIQETEFGNKILFDLNGKRTIIYNGTVIIQEK